MILALAVVGRSTRSAVGSEDDVGRRVAFAISVSFISSSILQIRLYGTIVTQAKR